MKDEERLHPYDGLPPLPSGWAPMDEPVAREPEALPPLPAGWEPVDGPAAPAAPVEADADGPGAFSRGFVTGLIEQNPKLTADTLEALSHQAPDRIRDVLLSGAGELREVAKLRPEEYATRSQGLWEIDGIDDALTWAGEGLGQVISSTLPPLALGAGGAAAGGRVGGRLGAVAGGTAGAFAGSYALNTGEVYRSLLEEGVEPKTASDYALITGSAMATLDQVFPTSLIKRLGGLDKVRTEVARRLARRVASEAAKGATQEGLTEVAQEAIKEAAVAAAAEKDFFTAETGKKLVEAGALGTMGGAAMGGPAGIMPDQVQAPATAPPPAAPPPAAEAEPPLPPGWELVVEPPAGAQQAEEPPAPGTAPMAPRQPARPADEPAQPPAPGTAPMAPRPVRPPPLPEGFVELGSREAPVTPGTADDVATAAQGVDPEPTEAQKEAGNYRKGHLRLQGLDITIENAKGSTRSGIGADGEPWSVEMPATYGYVKRTEGADGDQVDVYVGDDPTSDRVFVIDQVDAETSAFDEHKAILGTGDREEATTLYEAGFSDERGGDRVGGVTEMSVEEFRTWLRDGDQSKSLSRKEGADAEAVRGDQGQPAEEGRVGEEGEAVRGEDLQRQPEGERAPGDREAQAEAPVEPGDSAVVETDDGEQVTVTLTDKGPWDFNDTYPKPDQKLMEGLIREGRWEFGTVSEDPYTVEEVMHTFEESLGEMTSRQRDIVEGTRTLEQARAGTAKPPKRGMQVEDWIKRIETEVANARQDIEDTAAFYAGIFGDEVEQAMLDESEARVKMEMRSDPEPRVPPKETGKAETSTGKAPKAPETAETSTAEPAPPEEPKGPRVIVNELSAADLQEQTGPETAEQIEARTKRAEEFAAKDQGTHYAAGKAARAEGKPRELPSYFTKRTGKNPKDWFRGWDEGTPPAEPDAEPSSEWRVEPHEDDQGNKFRVARGRGDSQDTVWGHYKTAATAEKARARASESGAADPKVNVNAMGFFNSLGDLAAYVEKKAPGYRVAVYGANTPAELYGPDGNRLHQWSARPALADVDKLLAKLTAAPAEPKAKAYGADNKLVTQDRAAELRARLKAKLNEVRSGIDPEIIAIGTELTVFHIEAGARRFMDVAAALARDLDTDLGRLRPYLRSWYNGARDMMEDGGADVEGMDSPQDVRDALGDIDAIVAQQRADETTSPQSGTVAPEGEADAGSLGQPGARALEGTPADQVQGAEEGGRARGGAESGRRGDAPRDERPGSAGLPEPRGVGDRPGEAPVSAPGAGAGAGRAEPVGGPAEGRDQPAEPDRPGVRRGAGDVGSAATPAGERGSNFTITEADEIGAGGAKTKFRQNVAAIRLLRDLEAAGRMATRDEQAVLAKFVGWGGLQQAFGRDDGSVVQGWEREAAELRELLTDEELKAAASSTRNAHYTSTEIVTAMWKAMDRLGFRGGKVLEPSMGVGNFFGLMAPDVRAHSQMVGVELDGITGGIAKHLYPDADIHPGTGFQNITVPDNHFDLAIGNPPFGSERLYDAKHKAASDFSIHNFFFAKSLEGVKPGGMVAMVVSNFLMDASRSRARAYMAERADLVAAIRLPNDAFAATAGTEVTTDIVFLRKRAESDPVSGESWLETEVFTDPEGREVLLNEYFVRNPDQMLGEFGGYGEMYREGTAALIKREGQDTAALLDAAIARLPRNLLEPAGAPVKAETPAPVTETNAPVGAMFVAKGGKVMRRLEDVLNKQQSEPVTFPNDKARMRVVGMLRVRDEFANLRAAQLDEAVKDSELAALRKRLNKAYDTFVAKNGPINLDANKRLMRDDPTWPQLSALEDAFDRGISPTVAKKTGEKPRPPSARKAPVFERRTQSPYRAPTTASSAKDALATVLGEVGRADMEMMRRLYGRSEDEIVIELGDLIYHNPEGGYETYDHYLSGNVKAKLAAAEKAAAADPRYKRNVEALKEVIPADIDAVDIQVKPGSHWLPPKHVAAFIDHIAGTEGAKAFYIAALAKWDVNIARTSEGARTRWGTARSRVEDVIAAAINDRTIVVRDTFSDGSTAVNHQETDAANAKVQAVKDEWGRWLWQDDARREELHRLYNDSFNTDRERVYDGAHLVLPGKVGDDVVDLRPHQKSAVWRIVQSGTTLLDHVVGAGKTFAAIAATMELRRMGLANKPMLAVPNHLVGQWAADFIKLYPNANILAATKRDFEKDNRKRFFARVATGDWDAIIVAHSSFGRVRVDPEFEKAFIEGQIVDHMASMAALEEATGEKKSRNAKQISKKIDSLRERLKRLHDSDNKDDSLTFEEMGVDALIVDEAHEFKNLQFSTSMQRVMGLGNQAGSQKASDLYMKSQSVLERTNGRNMVFLTGTPVSNTMAEMFTMQRYLDDKNLRAQGLSHFDAWAKMFGEVVTDWELSPAGTYKLSSRFAKFVNMPELMQRYRSFADVITNDDIKRQLAEQGKTLPLPRVKGEKPENVVVQRSDAQAEYLGIPDENDQYPQGSLVWRAENLPKGPPKKGDDNMLKIMSDARKAALDMRLIYPDAGDAPGSKVHESADRMVDLYSRWNEQKGTQLVFIDLSTPKASRGKEAAELRALIQKAEEGDEAAAEALDKKSPDEFLALDGGEFSVYDDLRQKLVARGIPNDEIAFIHDANTDLRKEELFGKVRSGRVRFLFGSTAKMGAGMNVQERLVALHHLDAPWRPSDLEQREGRIIRQGNVLYNADPEGFEVSIFRYATKNTLDARMWQTIEGKARFIEQLKAGGTTTREVEDVAGQAANAAEMKAASSGNPLILEEMDLRQQLRKLDSAKVAHNREQFAVRDRLRRARHDIERTTERLPAMEADAERAAAARKAGFSMTIGDQTFEKHKEAGAALIARGKKMVEDKVDGEDLGTFAGFPMRLEYMGPEQRAEIVQTEKGLERGISTAHPFAVELVGAHTHQVTIEDIGSVDATGLAQRLWNTVGKLVDEPEKAARRQETARKDAADLETQVRDWPDEERFEALQQRHQAVLAELKPKKKEQPDPNAAPEEPTSLAAAGMVPGRPQTETPEFRRWFGDSKVVDDEGRPLRVFRGQSAVDWYTGEPLSILERSTEFPSFNDGEAGVRIAAFFTDSPDVANRFSTRFKPGPGQAPSTFPVYLSIQKPFEIDAAGERAGTVQFGPGGKPFRDAIRSGRYDGVIIRNTSDEGNLFVPLKPTQIKSAVGNRGGFDPNDPSILAQSATERAANPNNDVPQAAIDRVADWLATRGSGEIEAEQVPEALRLAATGDAAAVADLEAAGVPDNLMRPFYEDISDGGPPLARREEGQPDPVKIEEQERRVLERAMAAIVRRVAGREPRIFFADRMPLADTGMTPEQIERGQAAAEAAGGTALDTVGGLWQRNPASAETLIFIALQDPSFTPATSAYHEAFHHVMEVLATDEERAVLESADEQANLREFVNAQRGDTWADGMPAYEVATMAFEHYAMEGEGTGLSPLVIRLFRRLRLLLAEIKRLLTRRGYSSVTEIFDAAYLGRFTRRDESNARGSFPSEPGENLNTAAQRGFRPRRGQEEGTFEPPSYDWRAQLRDRTGTMLGRIMGAAETFSTMPRIYVQDRFHAVKRYQRQIAEAHGQPIPEFADPYLFDSLFQGVTGKRLDDLKMDRLEPLIETIHQRGLTLEEVDLFLYARFAPERNAHIADINPDLPDGGSGITDEEAAQILEEFDTAGKTAALEAVARQVDSLIQDTRSTLLAEGLISQEMFDAWSETRFYVPLRGWEADPDETETPDRPRIGRRYAIEGKEAHEALGRTSRADSPLAYVMLQAQQAIIRGEKNKVGKAFLDLVHNNPHPGVWQVDRKVPVRFINKLTGMVQEQQVLEDRADDVLPVKVSGVNHYIKMFDLNLARAVKGVGGDTLGPFVRVLHRMTRWLSYASTSLNPEFVISNFFRDLQTSQINVTQAELEGINRRILKDIPKAMRGVWQGSRGDRASEWAQHYHEFADAGAKTGWIEAYDIERNKRELIKALERLNPSTMQKGANALSALEKWISDVNMAVENGARLATFVHARRAGLSKAKAASLSRELTVNFNRKGEWGAMINAFYLFYNASIQGSVRMFQALGHKKVRRIVAGITIASLMIDALNRAVSDDDEDDQSFYDKIPFWEKERNLILMMPSFAGGERGAYIKVPLPWGYNVFHVLGQQTGAAIAGSTDPLEAAVNVGSTFLNSFNPIGGGVTLLNQMAPTVTKPIVEIYENKDWIGRPVMPVDFPGQVPTPDSEKYWSTVNPHAKWIAQNLNQITGGDDVRGGLISVSPESIEHWVQFMFGGAGAFALRTESAIEKWINGEDVESFEVPFTRRVYGEKSTWGDRDIYYQIRDAALLTEKQIKVLRETGRGQEAAEVMRDRASEVKMIGIVKKADSAIAKLRKARKGVEASQQSEEQKRKTLDAIAEREAQIMLAVRKRFNNLLNAEQ